MLLPPYIFTRYIAFSYLRSYAIVLGILAFGLVVSNGFDVINRYRSIELSLYYFLQLVTFKVPYLIGEISFFIGFIATLYFFRRLRRTQELTALLASGLSIMKVVTVIAMVQLLIGGVFTTIIGHIGPAMLNRVDELEMKIGATNSASNIQSIVFRKQIIVREGLENGSRIYKTSYIDVTANRLGELIVIILDDHGKYVSAYFAPEAQLNAGEMYIPRALYRGSDGTSIQEEDVILSTDLIIDNFTESVFAPENISFWRMRSKIHTLEKLGMPVGNYQLYHAKVLFRSVALVAWVIIAAIFIVGYSNRVAQSELKQILFPLLLVGGGYTLIENIARLLLQQSLNPYYAVLLPQLVLLFFAIFMILHLHED